MSSETETVIFFTVPQYHSYCDTIPRILPHRSILATRYSRGPIVWSWAPFWRIQTLYLPTRLGGLTQLPDYAAAHPGGSASLSLSRPATFDAMTSSRLATRTRTPSIVTAAALTRSASCPSTKLDGERCFPTVGHGARRRILLVTDVMASNSEIRGFRYGVQQPQSTLANSGEYLTGYVPDAPTRIGTRPGVVQSDLGPMNGPMRTPTAATRLRWR